MPGHINPFTGGEKRPPSNGELADIVYGTHVNSQSPQEHMSHLLDRLTQAQDRGDPEQIQATEFELSVFFQTHPELRDQDIPE